MQVIVDNIPITYVEAGSGKTLLCVHGWMDSHTAYKGLVEQLKDDYHIIALDMPNFGGSGSNDAVTKISDYAEFLAKFANKIKITDYSLVGHSMGCQVAMYGVAHKIITPIKLILLSPAGVRDNHKNYKTLLKYAAVAVRRFVPNSYKKKFYKMVGSDYDSNFSKIHKKIIGNALATDVQAEAALLKLPVLIVNGDVDRQTPLWMARILNDKITGSTLEIVKGADHWLQQKHPDLVANMIRIFVS